MTQNASMDLLNKELLASARMHLGGQLMINGNADIAPCLCVVMAVFNEVSTVEKIIETVLTQQPVNELIIVDDCSNDGTWTVLRNCASRDSRIKLFRHQKNTNQDHVELN